MTPETLRIAVRQANEFLRRAKLVQIENITSHFNGGVWRSVAHGPETAAAKRASMDLTRALANMRRVP